MKVVGNTIDSRLARAEVESTEDFSMSDRWAEVSISTLLEFTYGEVLRDFVIEGVADHVKDFFKSRVADTTELAGSCSVRFAVFKTLKQFLFVMEQELQETGAEEPSQYVTDLKYFLRDEAAIAVLARALSARAFDLPAVVLEERWCRLGLTPLPSDFDWEIVARRYARIAKKIFLGTEKLGAILQKEMPAIPTAQLPNRPIQLPNRTVRPH